MGNVVKRSEEAIKRSAELLEESEIRSRVQYIVDIIRCVPGINVTFDSSSALDSANLRQLVMDQLPAFPKPEILDLLTSLKYLPGIVVFEVDGESKCLILHACTSEISTGQFSESSASIEAILISSLFREFDSENIKFKSFLKEIDPDNIPPIYILMDFDSLKFNYYKGTPIPQVISKILNTTVVINSMEENAFNELRIQIDAYFAANNIHVDFSVIRPGELSVVLSNKIF